MVYILKGMKIHDKPHQQRCSGRSFCILSGALTTVFFGLLAQISAHASPRQPCTFAGTPGAPRMFYCGLLGGSQQGEGYPIPKLI